MSLKTETEIQDRVLHDMGNPQPKESKQFLREYARRVALLTKEKSDD